MSRHHTTSAPVLTLENWRTASRGRWSAGILMSATVEENGDHYRVVYGAPEKTFVAFMNRVCRIGRSAYRASCAEWSSVGWSTARSTRFRK
jgi:hypothetical protein